jgi:hypothetical protein
VANTSVGVVGEQVSVEAPDGTWLDGAADGGGELPPVGGGRFETYLALGLGAAAVGIDLALMRIGLDDQDEGYFLEQATRVLRGQLPYRDFDSLYTPGLLYLHALLLHLAGHPEVLILRGVGLLARVLLALGLYLLCRPLTRPLFAVLPALYVLVALDDIPVTWEPHPGWPSAALSVLTVLAFSRLPSLGDTGRGRWLVGLGALTAVVFLFKQNAGVFVGLAVVAYITWQGVDARWTPVTVWLRAAQFALIGVMVAAVAWLIAPHASPVVAAYFLVPIVAASGASLWGVSIRRRGRGLGSVIGAVCLLGLGFLVVTVPWLIALVLALGGRVSLLSGFVGSVDQDILWHPLEPPGTAAWASVFGCAVAVLLAVRVRQRPQACFLALTAAAVFAVCGVLVTASPDDSVLSAVLLWPGRAADHLKGLLPLMAIVAGAMWCLQAPPSRYRWHFLWLTVASAVTFLSEYPRIDDVHLAWSACLALGVGAVMLDKFFQWLGRRWQLHGKSRAVVVVTVLSLIVATTVPNVGERAKALLDFSPTGTTLASFSPLSGLTGVAGVLVRPSDANTLVATAMYVRAHTATGEPILVYPTSPLIYVMADRPNPTRFAHLYPGAASPEQLDAVIRTLQELPVRLVVVDNGSLKYWGPPSVNAALEDYLATQYTAVARFGDYRVLEKQ